ncbi:MAG: Ig-like domain-containing protein [Prosthecochloris sp.]|nr:Ig-like domain-containing protein [Prosthecochloris sp.]
MLIATADAGGTDERVVFRVVLDEASGNWTFDLEDQLDHVTGSGDSGTALQTTDPVTGSLGTVSNLNLTGLVEVTDADGDTVNLGDLAGSNELFTVTVENDIPALTTEASSGTATVGGTVHEDALGNDGDSDDAPTGIEEPPTTQVEQIEGDGETGNAASLSSLFRSGADAPVSYSFASLTSDEIVDKVGNLTSNSDTLSYAVDTTVGGEQVLIATADAGGPDERVVFRVVLDEASGNWTFDLEDQLDHVTGSGDSGTALQTTDPGTGDIGSVSNLNFTGLVEVTDADGDTVNLGELAGSNELFTVTVENDVPALTTEASSGTATVGGTVHEDALGNDGDSDDASKGIEETPTTQVEQIEGDGETGNAASLSSLFRSGADAPVSYSFASLTSEEIVGKLGNLTSNSDTLSYAVDTTVGGEQVLIATADAGGTDERVVFRVVLDESSGNWTFDLEDQLDHVTGSGDSGTALQTTDPGTGDIGSVSNLNLTGLVEVTDADGDTVNLGELAGSNELFTVTVENDVPVAHDVPFLQGSLYHTATYYVEEGGTSVSGNVMEASPSTYTNSWNADEVGADAQISLTGLEYYDWSTNSWEPVPGNGKAMYGTISMTENGDFTYVPDPYSNHPAPDHLMDKFRYTIEDADGDQDQAEFGVVVEDTEVTVTTAPIAGIDEASLSSGSDPSPVQPVAVTGSIGVEHQDPVDVKSFEFDPSTTIINGSETFDDLTSGGERIYYALSEDETYITAYTYGGTGEPSADYVPPVSDYVFTLEIDTTVSGDPGYEFTLYKPLDHTDDISVDDPIEGRQIVLPFEFQIFEPDDHDKAQSVLNIKVLDDASAASKDVEVLEDQSITFTTNADGSPSNITITTEPSYGNYVVNADGTITYNPSEHFSGQDLLKYTYTNDNGTVSTEKTVSITVKPVADAPDVMDDYGITTTEDTPVALGLTAPVVTDDTDTYGAGVTGDDPERLGLITVSGIPEGAKVFKADGTLIFTGTSTDDDFTVQLDEAGTDDESIHINGVSGEVVLSIAEFNALRILPPADDATDFTVKMRVTEYEVDASGNPVNAPTDTNGETAETEVTVEVHAVTDRVDLKWIDEADESPYDQADPVDDDTFGTVPDSMDEIKDTVEDGTLNKYIDEGDTLNLSQLLEFNANDPVVDHTDLTTIGQNGDDDDGSEDRWLVLDDLPAGFVVTADGSSISPENDGTYIIPLVNNDNDLPSIIISPPSDFSGEVTDYSIALYTKDTDADTTVTTVEKSDEVSLNLYIMPQAGDVSAPDVSTSEDTPVKFLENLEVTDASTGLDDGGEEAITLITVSDVPVDWVIRDESGTAVQADGAGNYSISTSTYDQYTITPSAHSSADGTVTVSVTTEDKSNVDGSPNPDTHTKTTDLDIAIKVTPVAERIGTDSDEDGQTDTPLPDIADTDENGMADLQMNPSHTYTHTGNEDEWFDLSEDETFQLQDGWNNEDSDGSEITYALLTPLDGSGNPLIGAQFSLDGSTVYATCSGSPVQVPVGDLDDLQFRPPANYAADDIQIKVEAKTVDTDPDDSSTNTQISGEVYLTLNVGPVADLVTLQANTPGGYEDEAIPLYIKPSSSDKDGSETYTIKIADIPEGAKIEYWDASSSSYQTFTATAASTELSISRFDQTKDLTITPPLNSNADFVLQVSGKSVDTVGATVVESSLSDSLPLEVSVRGVADVTNDAVTTARYTEAEVDSVLNNEIPLLESTEGPWQSSALTDTDGSETMSVMLTDLTSDFDLSGSGLVFLGGTGSDRQWIVSRADLDNVKIVTPEHFSGTITLNATLMTTENDGHTLSAADGFTDNPVTLDLTVEVTPTPEAILATGTSASEDTLTKLDMSLVGPDSSESLTSVQIKIDDVDNGDFTLYWGDSTAATLEAAANDSFITEVSVSGNYYEITGAAAVGNIYVLGAADSHGGPYDVEVKYTVTDTTDDGTLTDESSEKTATHSVTVAAVTDDITETLGYIVSSETAHASISGSTVDLTGTTELTVPVTVSQQDQVEGGDVGMNGPDADGSETLLRFEITNVPEGVAVDGATYSGDVYNPATGEYENSGRWIIDVNEDFSAQDIGEYIVLKIDGSWDELQGLSDQVVTIRAYSADDGDEETFAAQTVTLNVTGGDASSFTGIPESYPTITTWNGNPDFTPVEDTASPLNEMIDSSSVGGSGDFTVTISGLPTGSSVQGIGVDSFTHNGQTVWTVSGSGGTSDLQDLLANVTITPPPDYNSNNSAPLDFDLTLTTYGGSSQENAVVDVVRDVVPDSDTTSVVITAADVGEEGQSAMITVRLENDADDPHTILQDDKLYIQLDESGMTEAGGSLALDSGGSGMITVTNPAGLPEGSYYEISGVTYGNEVKLIYTSANDDASGSVRVSGYVLTSEENEPVGDVDILVGSGAGVFTVAPYVDGYDSEVKNSTGDEFNGGTASSSDWIVLDIDDNGLLDADGSETTVSAIISGVPNGFLVYAGADAASATMVLNGGDDGSGSDTNQWILTPDSDGTLPDYIGVQPPEDVSGSFDLSLDIVVQESDGSQKAQSDTFTLTVDPVAYAIDSSCFNPTDTFGDEGDMVPLNLNVSLEDTVDYYPSDSGVDDLETVTLTFSGIGPYASFYDAQGDYIDSVSYEAGTDTYTVSGIPADKINDVSFVQSAFEGSVDVTLYTVDGSSDSSAAAVTGAFDVTVYEAIPSTGDDVLLYDGVADAGGSRSYNGLAGDDVLQMRNNEDLDFNDSPDIGNLEVLDMSNDTANEVRNLSPEDVLDITDSTNKLFIDADGDDSVLGEPGSTWNQGPDQSIGGTTYEVYSAAVSTAGGAETVTLYVDNEASISL